MVLILKTMMLKILEMIPFTTRKRLKQTFLRAVNENIKVPDVILELKLSSMLRSFTRSVMVPAISMFDPFFRLSKMRPLSVENEPPTNQFNLLKSFIQCV
ncbi:hypothetical protein NC651_012104 [Populus alba x Populus x berolinensis]|nr:hypothetical protein NC651_012104 [Populus alba x Populus x berolinensis]